MRGDIGQSAALRKSRGHGEKRACRKAQGESKGMTHVMGDDGEAVMASWSRLLIDPNRGEDDPTLIRQIYDRAVVPGNHPLTAEEREDRMERYYRPYHRRVSETIEAVRAASGRAPMVISVHSFTPEMQGRRRPWEVGVLWDRDDRVAKLLIAALDAEHGHIVGDNEPYDGALHGDTMFRHCTVPGYPHALIEIRQDLVADEAGQREWALDASASVGQPRLKRAGRFRRPEFPETDRGRYPHLANRRRRPAARLHRARRAAGG
jgi:predicted N-formylglutamate amidohydrolase